MYWKSGHFYDLSTNTGGSNFDWKQSNLSRCYDLVWARSRNLNLGVKIVSPPPTPEQKHELVLCTAVLEWGVPSTACFAQF